MIANTCHCLDETSLLHLHDEEGIFTKEMKPDYES